MIKYYKLALTVLLVSCFLSNTMETTQKYETTQKRIENKTVVILSNPKFLRIRKGLLTLDGINLIPYPEIPLLSQIAVQKKIDQIIGKDKFVNRWGLDELGYFRINISDEETNQLLKIKEIVKIVSFCDLDIDKLLKYRKNGKNPASCDIIKKDSGQPMRTESENKKETMGVVLSNPNLLYFGVSIIKPYPQIHPDFVHFTLINIMKEKLKQVIGMENTNFNQWDKRGYFSVKISSNQKRELLNIKGIAKVGPYKDLNFEKLDTCRNKGDTTLDGIFQDKEKK